MVRRAGVIHTSKSKWLVRVYLVKLFGPDAPFRGGLGNDIAGTGYY